MEAIVERVCGLDVHQAKIVACLLVGRAHEKPKKTVRTFGTMKHDLEELKSWLASEGCTVVGMESTGMYWKPVYNILEGDGLDIVVGNARKIKNVPGRKTDVKDSEWIADLLRHGLIAKSFVPPKPIRELRDLLRYRTKLVQCQTAEQNRLLGMLETANIKVASVASSVFGVSGMRMLKALTAGVTSPGELAQLAKGRLRKKIPSLELALDGRFEDHHRFMLTQQVRRLEALQADIAQLDHRIDEKLEPYGVQHRLLMTIPGVNRVVAATLIAELGIDMTVFLSVYHLASWTGLCPGNNESAGKRYAGTTRKGNAHLKTMLVQAVLGAAKQRGTFFKAKYHKLRARIGPKRAAVAVAHKILVVAYHMLRTGEIYQELGDTYLDDKARKRKVNHLVRELQRLGHEVTVTARTEELPTPA